MENLVINFEENVKKYDNKGAHEAVKRIMHKFENVDVCFKTGKDNFPYAWLESRSTVGFKLILNAKELNWLMRYLINGETEDFGTEPENVEASEEGSDLQFSIFKQLVEKGKTLQFVPKFRAANGFVTAYASFKKGKIVFRLKEADELNEYMAEKKLI